MTNPSSDSTGQKLRRKHSKEFTEQAVLRARKPDMGFGRASNDLGISESLLRKWADLSSTKGSAAFRGHCVRTEQEARIAALERENRILREGAEVKYRFIEGHRPLWHLRALCRILRASMSGYFAWRDGREPPRRSAGRALTTQIAAIDQQQQQQEISGIPRIHRALRQQGTRVSRKRVERLMRCAVIRVTPARRFTVTTDSNHDQPIAANLLRQDFHADAPNQKWVTDITYISTNEGWLYLAAIIDLPSQRVVGWAMSSTMETSVVRSPLDMALGNTPAGHRSLARQ